MVIGETLDILIESNGPKIRFSSLFVMPLLPFLLHIASFPFSIQEHVRLSKIRLGTSIRCTIRARAYRSPLAIFDQLWDFF